jgi:hypothetical protein
VILAEEVPVVLPGVFLAAHRFDNVLAVEHPDQSVNLRHFGQQLGLVTLDETPRHDDALAPAARLHLHRFADRAQGLGFGRFQKPARVDDDGVRTGGVIGDRQPVLGEQAQHALAVHKVFRAPQADEGDRLNRLTGPGGH